MHRFATTAQQRRIAGPHTKGGGIGGYIRAAFIDDPDQPDRHTHAAQFEAVGAFGPIDHLADRVGQIRHRFYAGGNAFEPRLIEPKAVEHRITQPAFLAGSKVERIFGQNVRAVFAQCSRSKLERLGLGLARHTGKLALRRATGARQVRDQFLRIGLVCLCKRSHIFCLAARTPHVSE